MAEAKGDDTGESIAHCEFSSHLEIEQGNAAVLFDIGEGRGEKGQVSLKLSKDGRVRYKLYS